MGSIPDVERPRAKGAELHSDAKASSAVSIHVGARRLSILVALCVACLAATALAAPAAMAAYVNTGHFADSGNFSGGTEHGEMDNPQRAVVEASTGDLYVADRENYRVQVFAPTDDTAEYLTQINVPEFGEPFGIAIDESGPTTVLYVSVGDYFGNNGKIFKYVSDGAAVPTFTAAPGFTSPEAGSGVGQIENFKAPLAVDPATGDFLVADPGDDLVKRFDSAGAFISSFDGSTSPGGAFTGLLDMAVDSTGEVVVIDSPTGQVSDLVNGGATRILRFDSSGAYQSTIGPVEGAGVLGIDPNTDDVYVVGNFASLHNEQPLHVWVFDASNSSVEDFNMGEASKRDVGSGVAVAPGPAHRLYVVANLAEIFAGNMTIEVFEQPVPGLPTSTVGPLALAPGTTTAKLEGKVDPHALQTTYWFEYGTTTAYGNDTPASNEADAGSGIVGLPVSRFIGGLQPATTYHYRLVATNEMGTVQSADATFTTAPVPASEEERSDRGYEMVSPVQKNNFDVLIQRNTIRASLSGDSAIFGAHGGFGDVESNALNTGFRGTRNAEGSWSSVGIVPPVVREISGAGPSGRVRAFSNDLSKEVVVSRLPLTPEADDNWNLYLRDNDTRSYTLLTPVGTEALPEGYEFVDASDDFSHIVFRSPIPLLPGDPTPPEMNFKANLYEWTDGQLRLVSVLPNGEPDPNGGWGGLAVVEGSFPEEQHVVSADGSKIFWSDPVTGQLYVRINGTSTVHVSASRDGTVDPDGTQVADFLEASPDGSRVYFATCEELTEDATPRSGDCGVYNPSQALTETQGDLYEYNTNTATLTDLLKGDVGGLVGTSEDGSYVYFVSTEALTEDAPTLTDGQGNPVPLRHVYLLHEGQITYIASAGTSIQESDNATPTTGNGSTWKLSAVTPDGRYALLWSKRPMTGYDTGGFGQYYRYDALKDQLLCLSCNEQAVRATAEAISLTPETIGLPGSTYNNFTPRSFTPDGRAFFHTADPLVPHDTNGKSDVYEATVSGRPRLISGGQGPDPSYFEDVGASGRDVFFVTRDRLVKGDVDDNVDLYDARVGGGAGEQLAPAADCQGDACQSPPNPPNDATPASATFNGQGNVKRHHRHRRHHKKRHDKKRHSDSAAQQRHANHRANG
jgi:NHL repeat-containing protein